jgi:HPt (histidine-containing phosphotransfer) domain-containing protein
MHKHLSLESLQNLDIIDPGLAVQMMNVFLSEFPQHVQNIQKLIAAENSVELGRRIHALKGSISIFGCTDICTSLKTIELLAKDMKFKEAVAMYEKDKANIDEFVAEIQFYLTAEANKSAAA